MTTLYDPSRSVKPTCPAAFGSGILPPRRPRFAPSASDLAWAAATSPGRDEGYEVVIPAPAPISGGAPADVHPAEVWERLAAEVEEDAHYDHLAALAATVDLLSRGLDGCDHSGSFAGHPA
jgi:hypothetical protein